MQFISIPTECPICKGPVAIVKKYNTEVLMCKNPNCKVKLEGRILHFIGANGLDIESMSVKTVQKLIELKWLTKLSDIFALKNHRDEWINLSGFGQNSVDKILEAIPTSIELWRVIASAGIPNVEKQTAILLADYFKTWDAFRTAVKDKLDFTILNGLGSITSETLLNFDYSEIDEVMNYLTLKEKVVNGKLTNMSFCITGKLSMKRDDLVKIIEQNGGKIASVNKNLTYLICNDKDSTSGKSKKAAELGVKVITEDEFNSILKEN